MKIIRPLFFVLSVIFLGLGSLTYNVDALSAQSLKGCLSKVDRSLEYKVARAHENLQLKVLTPTKFLKRIFAIEDWHEQAKAQCVGHTVFNQCDTQTIISCSYSPRAPEEMKCDLTLNEGATVVSLRSCSRPIAALR